MHCTKHLLSYINVRLYYHLFNHASAQAILSISSPLCPTPDKLIWVLDSKGAFTVKSAFQALCSLPEAQPTPSPNWKKLWNLKVLDWTKMFLWRLCANVLPTRENIKRRMSLNDDSCLLCFDFPEELIHLFLRCPTAKALWFTAYWGFRSEDFTTSTSNDITNLDLNPSLPTLQVSDQITVSLSMAFTLEEIWHLRNSNLHSKSPLNLADSVHLIHRRVRECTEANSKPSLPSLLATSSLWVPPPSGWIKVNLHSSPSSFQTL